jgi:hypothetical protein
VTGVTLGGTIGCNITNVVVYVILDLLCYMSSNMTRVKNSTAMCNLDLFSGMEGNFIRVVASISAKLSERKTLKHKPRGQS